ncbi:hypothetical protein Aperf_G00000057282 [Anoplocephala perfoliata]
MKSTIVGLLLLTAVSQSSILPEYGVQRSESIRSGPIYAPESQKSEYGGPNYSSNLGRKDAGVLNDHMTWQSGYSNLRPDYRGDQQSGHSGSRPTPQEREDHRRYSGRTNGRQGYSKSTPDYQGSQQNGYKDERGGKTATGSPISYNRGGSKNGIQRQNSYESQQESNSYESFSNYAYRYSGYPPRQAKPIPSHGIPPSYENQQAYSPNYETPVPYGNDGQHNYPTPGETQPMPVYGGRGSHGMSAQAPYENQPSRQEIKYPLRETEPIGSHEEKSQPNRFQDQQRVEPGESFQKVGMDPYEAHKAEIERLAKLNEERMRRYEEEKAKYYKTHS